MLCRALFPFLHGRFFYPTSRMTTAQAPLPPAEGAGHERVIPHVHITRDRKLAYSTVGTPDYIAPEVLLKKGYGACEGR